jgi:GNAT superfamily N-acetyltransferase
LKAQIRGAKIADISRLMAIRFAVKENTLSDPTLITFDDYVTFISSRGKGWVATLDGEIVGFSIVDLVENNVWALFVDPNFERKGLGKKLQNRMLDWYFEQTSKSIWLGTEPNTRAADFYLNSGWTKTGLHGKDEIKFEMTAKNWQSIKETEE